MSICCTSISVFIFSSNDLGFSIYLFITEIMAFCCSCFSNMLLYYEFSFFFILYFSCFFKTKKRTKFVIFVIFVFYNKKTVFKNHKQMTYLVIIFENRSSNNF